MIRLALRVRGDDEGVVLAELLALAPGGVEEADLGDGVVEYAIYGAAGELPDLGAWRAAAGGALVEVDSREVADDWAERWREFHRPVQAGAMRVRAPWHEGEGIVIDPGQAFGTGGHATTRLCLEALQDLEPGGDFADLGCGSGVLAIAAAQLGWAPVLALDFDPLAVEATSANAAANGVELDVRRWDLRVEAAPAAPTVAANLLRPLLLELRFSEPPRALVASGLLAEEADEVCAALAARTRLRVARCRVEGDWAALTLVA